MCELWQHVTKLAPANLMLKLICSNFDAVSGKEQFGTVLRDGEVVERVSHTTRALAERSKVLGQQGWTGLKGIYANVASRVETVAKENGYDINLGN